jgi:hypothetical protein
MQLIKVFLLVLSFAFCNGAIAGVKVRFLNGIQNTEKDMEKSVDALFTSYNLYKTAAMPKLVRSDFASYANPKDPLIFRDDIELAIQGTISGIAQEYAESELDLKLVKAKKAGLTISTTVANQWYQSIYQNTLSELYANYLVGSKSTGKINIAGVINDTLLKIRTDLQDGSSIVIVSHSQGNLFAEAINSQLNDSEKNKVRFVGVASVASTTPNNRYVTFKTDLAVYGAYNGLRVAIAQFASAPLSKTDDGYYTGPEGISSFWDAIKDIVTPLSWSKCFLRTINCPSLMGHSFTDVYMNSSVVVSENDLTTIAQKIIGYVADSIKELNPPTTNFQINPIIFKNINNGTTTYNSGLVLYMPTSTAYDNATVAGIGTENLTGGVAVLQTVSGQPSLQVMQSNGIASGDILQIQAPVATDYIPAGSVYTVKLYKRTNLVATQTVTLAAKLVTPQEGATAEFPSVTLTTYADLCPKGVATTASYFSIPSSLPNSPQNRLSCGASVASVDVESGDSSNRRFNTILTVVAMPTPSLNLLQGATVSDSCFNCTIAYNGDPNNITDGNMGSGRNLAMQSGTFHIFLTNPKSIGRLKLLPAMTPNGLVYYEIQTSTDPTGAVGTWTSHGGEKSSEWANNTWFDFTLNTNTQNVRVIKVNVTYTPSWLAFFEIEAYAP